MHFISFHCISLHFIAFHCTSLRNSCTIRACSDCKLFLVKGSSHLQGSSSSPKPFVSTCCSWPPPSPACGTAWPWGTSWLTALDGCDWGLSYKGHTEIFKWSHYRSDIVKVSLLHILLLEPSVRYRFEEFISVFITIYKCTF